MKYTTVYNFCALDEIKRGAVVYVLDKREKEVIFLNSMSVDYALRTIAEAENDSNRFVFWKEARENA